MVVSLPSLSPFEIDLLDIYAPTYPQYTPVLEDNVVGVVREKQGEQFKIDIGASHIANLPFLAFEGATKRNRPNLEVLYFSPSFSADNQYI